MDQSRNVVAANCREMLSPAGMTCHAYSALTCGETDYYGMVAWQAGTCPRWTGWITMSLSVVFYPKFTDRAKSWVYTCAVSQRKLRAKWSMVQSRCLYHRYAVLNRNESHTTSHTLQVTGRSHRTQPLEIRMPRSRVKCHACIVGDTVCPDSNLPVIATRSKHTRILGIPCNTGRARNGVVASIESTTMSSQRIN